MTEDDFITTWPQATEPLRDETLALPERSAPRRDQLLDQIFTEDADLLRRLAE